MKRKPFLVLASLVWICQARAGFSQTPEERAGARAAADQGYDAFERGDWKGAIDLFGRAESLVHSSVHLLYIARSNARLDRLIEAQEAYLHIVRESLPADAAPAMRQAQQQATRELAELEPQIPFVSIEVEGASSTEPLEVTQDGRVLPPALVGVARPLDPGEHTWRARSGSRQSALETRKVERGSRLTLKLHLPEAEIELVPAQKAAPTPPPAATTEHASSGPSPWVYVGFGVAAAGLGVGTAFLLQQDNIEDRIRDSCSDQGCFATPDNIALKEEADRAGVISAVGFTVGGVALAGAFALWLFAPDAPPAPAASTTLGPRGAPAAEGRVQLWFGSNSAGVRGSF